MRTSDVPRVLVDAVHPAHVHTFRHVAADLTARGAAVRWLSRHRAGVPDLLDGLGIPHEVVSVAARRRGRTTDAVELAVRVGRIRRRIGSWRPHVLLTRNPSGALAGLGTRTWTVFDTDDGTAVGPHHHLAVASADVIASSVHDPVDHGARHRRYPGLKAHAFLHPSRFRPDPTARRRAGVPDGHLTVVRFSRHDAAHDRAITGLSPETRSRLLDLLRAAGPVVVSSEGEPTRLIVGGDDVGTLPPTDFHDLLATASLCVTDGQSVAAEAAVLGVPALRLSGFTGRVGYLAWLEDLGLVRNFAPGEEAALLTAVADAVAGAGPDRTSPAPTGSDVTGWLVDLTLELAATPKPRRPGPVTRPAAPRSPTSR